MPASDRFPPHVEPDPGLGRGPSEARGDEDLDRLVPAARLPERARVRIGVGAAIVLLLAALVITVVVSAIGQQAASPGVVVANAVDPVGATGTPDAPGDLSNPNVAAGGSRARSDAETAAGSIIFVHILGAVERPGLFELPGGARVIDAIAAAGGLTAAADPAGANLARKLGDGEQLYLPQVGEVPLGAPAGAAPGGTSAGPGVAAAGGAAGAVVNLNTATVADLDALPRIGPAMAQRIVDFREANGPFTATDELRNITGIGDKTFEALKDLVSV